MSKSISTVLLFVGLIALTGGQDNNQSATQSMPQIGYKSAAGAEQKKTLLLKDFKPVSMLHASAHHVDRAKYYVIDVHNHVNDAQGIEERMPPERVMVFTQMDWSKIHDPNFSQEMVAQLDDAVSRGAQGLKILKEFGLGVKDKTGKLIAVDDPRLDAVWEECGRLGIPVSIHVSDPEAFFQSYRQHQ
jgi:hypothetical protein